MSSENRCEACGARNTGWRPVWHFGRRCCPACAQGVKRESAGDMLARRRALLEKLQAAGDTHPGVVRFRREIEKSVERLEGRMGENTDRL